MRLIIFLSKFSNFLLLRIIVKSSNAINVFFISRSLERFQQFFTSLCLNFGPRWSWIFFKIFLYDKTKKKVLFVSMQTFSTLFLWKKCFEMTLRKNYEILALYALFLKKNLFGHKIFHTKLHKLNGFSKKSFDQIFSIKLHENSVHKYCTQKTKLFLFNLWSVTI